MADDSLELTVGDNSLELEVNPPYVGSAFSPEVDIEETTSTITVTITDARGEHSYSVPNTESAIADAESATAAATSAASAATSAASAAGTATTAANSAASAANSAASGASTAAALANEKAGVAVQAASDANSAAEVASAKATLANTAATAANAAASAAGNAASAATSAAGYADIATRDASAAADAANSAADAANASAAAAESATGTVDAAVASANSAAAYANEKGGLASNAANAANSAASSATSAASAANSAASTASTAATNANSKASAANTAAGAANTAASAANTAAEAANTAAEYASEFTEAYLPMVTAGISESLLATDVTVDTFAQRVSDHDGGVRIKSLRGNTVRWNQLCDHFTEEEYPQKNTSRASYVFNDGIVTVTPITTGLQYRAHANTGQGGENVPANHVCYLSCEYYTNVMQDARLGCFGSQTSVAITEVNKWVRAKAVFTIPSTIIPSSNDGVLFGMNWQTTPSPGDEWKMRNPVCIDLTVMFGAGNEPQTVAEFERMYPESYYPYDAGSLLSVNIEGIESAGIVREIPTGTLFSDGLRSAGSVYDELTSDKAITRVGSRDYQSGDESDTSIITDGTTTHYALSTPVVVAIDPPLNLAYPTEQGGIESIVIPTGEMSAAPTMAVVYAYDADGVRDLSQAIIANIEGNTASTNYSVGGYFVHDGKLYKATSAIATGETITPSTNCIQTTVMAELLTLTA